MEYGIYNTKTLFCDFRNIDKKYIGYPELNRYQPTNAYLTKKITGLKHFDRMTPRRTLLLIK